MAAEDLPAPRTNRLRYLPILIVYVAVLVAAETLLALGAAPADAGYQQAALALHIVLVFALIAHGVVAYPRSPVLSALLVAMSLASLVRVYSLALPAFPGQELPRDTVQRLAVVSVPLLTSIVAVAYVQRLRPRDLGLRFLPLRPSLVQAGIALTGIPLGLLEYAILRPEPWIGPWMVPLDLTPFLGASLAIFIATGVSEEIIFRGILLRRAMEALGSDGGLLFVSVAFTALHIFFRSAADLAFVFGVALFYGVATIRTRCLWGVIGSHTLGNVVLYLIAPYVIG